jgi:hypothetical protein
VKEAKWRNQTGALQEGLILKLQEARGRLWPGEMSHVCLGPPLRAVLGNPTEDGVGRKQAVSVMAAEVLATVTIGPESSRLCILSVTQVSSLGS